MIVVVNCLLGACYLWLVGEEEHVRQEWVVLAFGFVIPLPAFILRQIGRDFPGDTVVKNPPANAGDTGSNPGPGRSHTPWSNWACAPQLLSLRFRAREPQLLSLRAATTEAHAPRARAPQQEKPPQWEAHTPQWEAHTPQWRVAPARRN